MLQVTQPGCSYAGMTQLPPWALGKTITGVAAESSLVVLACTPPPSFSFLFFFFMKSFAFSPQHSDSGDFSLWYAILEGRWVWLLHQRPGLCEGRGLLAIHPSPTSPPPRLLRRAP